MENTGISLDVYPGVKQEKLGRWLLETHPGYSFVGEMGRLAVLSADKIAPQAKVIRSGREPSFLRPLEVLVPSTNKAYVAQVKNAVKDSLGSELPVNVHQIKNVREGFSIGPWSFGRGFYWDEKEEQLYLRSAGVQTPLPNEALEPWRLHYGDNEVSLQVLNPYSVYGLALSGVARVNARTTAALRQKLLPGNTIGNVPPEHRQMVLAYHEHARRTKAMSVSV